MSQPSVEVSFFESTIASPLKMLGLLALYQAIAFPCPLNKT